MSHESANSRGLPAPVTAKKHNRSILTQGRSKFRKRKQASDFDSSETKELQSQPSDASQSNQEPPVLVTERDVLEVVTMHKCFRHPTLRGYEVRDLPNLDDVTRYEVSEEIEQQLWAKEVSRLVEAVTTTTPLEFHGSKDLTVDSKKSYEILAHIVDEVWRALKIIEYDAENVLAEHYKRLMQPDDLKQKRLDLEYICNRDEDAIKAGEDAVARGNLEDIFGFVNYITAVLARVMSNVADGKAVHHNLLAQIAKISTKVKVLSTNTQEFAQRSIDNSVYEDEVLVPDLHGFGGRQPNVSPEERQNRSSDPASSLKSFQDLRNDSSQAELLSNNVFLKDMYFADSRKFRLGALNPLQLLIGYLRGRNKVVSMSLTSYEICAMVYETGFERFYTMVYQDYQNDFLGTSEASFINCARSAFNVLEQTARHLHDGRESPTPPCDGETDENKSVGTRLYWNDLGDGRGRDSQATKTTQLQSMSQVITMLVPLMMTSPIFVREISGFITVLIFAALDTDRQRNSIAPRTYDNYTAFFCLTTDEYNAEQGGRELAGATSLSKALMGRSNLLSGKSVADIGRVASFAFGADALGKDPDENSSMIMERVQRHQSEVEHISNRMKDWVFEEKGVMVKCRTYVSTLILVCALLVGGGVSTGMTVGERIPGVDPFNITAFCWVLAAFLLLAAKSIRVQNWPWNDFLHGRVLCKSVSELSSVTRIQDQLILAKILQDESISFLQTRGPFNTVFRRQSEDGFSIDRPLSTWTMLLSGLIMIEVDAAHGRGLVCLDLRRNTPIRTILRLGEYKTDTEFIYCDRLSQGNDEDAHGGPHRVRLQKGDFAWMRALGFYGNRSAKFI